MSSPFGDTTHIVKGVSAVDCRKQVRSWRILRSLIRFLVPTCNCSYFEEQEKVEERDQNKAERTGIHFNNYYHYPQSSIVCNNTNTITGTLFGYRNGKVRFCIQSNSKTIRPILLLELAVSTVMLAKEMQSGLLRIALKCNTDQPERGTPPLLSVPIWSMYCNGRKTGFAVKRRPTQVDVEVLRLMRGVFVGTGTISGKKLKCDDELMYFRANFERVVGSSDSETFHLISPDGSSGQELSIFFLRNRS